MFGLDRFRSNDAGVVVMLFSVLVGTGLLFIMLALVIDLGALRVERTELRRAADAAVVSAAYDCSFNPTTLVSSNCGTANYTSPTGVSPQRLSDRNSIDGLGTVYHICGNDSRAGSTSRLISYPCDYTRPVSSRDCLTKPMDDPYNPDRAMNRDYVEVAVQTKTSSGQRVLPIFGKFFGAQGSTLYACSQAAWAAPTGIPETLGLALSKTCWSSATTAGSNYPAAPPYATDAARQAIAVTYEKALVLPGGSKNGTGPCEQATTGPGGFGFVLVDNCMVTPSVGTLTSDVGADGHKCKTTLPAHQYKLVNLPVYDNDPASGNFNVVGFAPFFLTGWDLPAVSRVTPLAPSVNCPGGDKCLFGWFTQSTLLTDSVTRIDPGQQGFGLNVVKLVG